MTIKVIATIEIAAGGEDYANQYFAATMPLLEQARAEIIDQMTVDHAIVGDRVGAQIFVVLYPDIAALNSVFESDAYKQIIPTRDKAFSKYSINVIKNDP